MLQYYYIQQKRFFESPKAFWHPHSNAKGIFKENWRNKMSTVSVRLPESIHNRVKILAKREKVSINQLITIALAEKLSALDTEDYLKERAKLGDRSKFEKALSKVSDINPEEYDRL
jgi:hypothetical protein